MGGATLIAIAIVVFAVLVSAQVFRDWPIAALGDGGGETAVSSAEPAGGAVPVGSGTASNAGAKSVTAVTGETKRHQTSTRTSDNAGSVATGDLATTGAGQGSTETGGSAGGQDGGSETTASPQTDSSPSDSSGSASSGGGGSAPAGGAGGGSAGGGGGGATSGNTTPSTSGQVTETVNNTVSQVDETVLDGTLENTGVTGVTEGVVGPESVVGKVVDETVGAVGGLLSGKR
jgi:hypothetical protein